MDKYTLIQYFLKASGQQSIDPSCFDIEDFTEQWLRENKIGNCGYNPSTQVIGFRVGSDTYYFGRDGIARNKKGEEWQT